MKKIVRRTYLTTISGSYIGQILPAKCKSLVKLAMASFPHALHFSAKNYLRFTPRIVVKQVLRLIRIYQNNLSLDHSPMSRLYPGGYCKFQPTCSQYTYESIEKYGLIRGIPKGLWRICRCHPWSKGGWDPVEPDNVKFLMSNDKSNPKSK